MDFKKLLKLVEDDAKSELKYHNEFLKLEKEIIKSKNITDADMARISNCREHQRLHIGKYSALCKVASTIRKNLNLKIPNNDYYEHTLID